MNYTDLRAALTAYLKRTDPETVANEPNAIEFSRMVLEKVLFPIESETLAAPLPVTAGVVALPVDFGQAIAVNDGFEYIAPREWMHLATVAPGALARRYSIFGQSLYVEQRLTEISFLYNARPLAITGTEENWLSQFYAPVWLHAARAEQYRFIEDLQSMLAADQEWRGLVTEANATSERRRQSGGVLRMRSR